MAAIAPNSTIILFKDIPFDPAYNDTMYFASKTAQTSWFSNLPAAKKRTYTNISYQRRSRNTIRLEEVYANVFDVNYMAFKNTSFENKWFFAFVESVEYINNSTVEITYQLDVIQSWLFDDPVTNLAKRFSQCTIERCHTRTDVAGENTLPESMPLGEYIAPSPFTIADRDTYISQPVIIVASNIDFTNPDDFAPGRIVKGGISLGMGDYYSGLYLQEVPLSKVADLNAWLEQITEDGIISSIVSISMADGHFINTTGNPIDPSEIYISRPASLVGYTPKNKKLLTYPYTYAALSDMVGHENKYPFEYFSELGPLDPKYGSVVFKIWGNNNTMSSLMCWPSQYKGKQDNYDEGMESTPFPQCAWNNDTFKAMMAQFWSNAIAQVASAGVSSAIAGGLSGGIVGGVASGIGSAAGAAVGQIGNLAGIMADPTNDVPTLHGNSNASIAYQNHGIGFELVKKSIRPEYAAIIDKYFDMYGYRVETVGIPDINARPKWTYVKTRGASVHGLMPSDDARKIEGIFNNGIRFWTVQAGFGDYSQDNSPV